MGYAFINFIDSIFIVDFFKRFDSKRWECFNSDKICKITYGRMQGKQELEANFSNMHTSNSSSSLASERQQKVRPLILSPNIPSKASVENLRLNLIDQQHKLANSIPFKI